MLTINLLPWREYARARQKKLFKLITLLTVMLSVMAYILTYHHVKVELQNIDEHIIRLTKKSEKYAHKSDNTLIELQKIISKTRRNHAQLKKLLHAMLVYSTINWNSFEVQKGIIKVYGVANQMTLLLSFMDYCEKRFDFTLAIKSIKILSPFDAIKFQVQTDRIGVGLKNNALD